jgi:hypothetical protein
MRGKIEQGAALRAMPKQMRLRRHIAILPSDARAK